MQHWRFLEATLGHGELSDMGHWGHPVKGPYYQKNSVTFLWCKYFLNPNYILYTYIQITMLDIGLDYAVVNNVATTYLGVICTKLFAGTLLSPVENVRYKRKL